MDDVIVACYRLAGTCYRTAACRCAAATTGTGLQEQGQREKKQGACSTALLLAEVDGARQDGSSPVFVLCVAVSQTSCRRSK